ncbi:MAG: polysaccharide deacetylase family protein [Ancrocorticia sp.]|nr:polysaccharide deacetylase family protein [Ancrocorticia sp.]
MAAIALSGCSTALGGSPSTSRSASASQSPSAATSTSATASASPTTSPTPTTSLTPTATASASPTASASAAASPTPAASSTESSSAASGIDPTIDCAQLKCVALTFDDGPGPYTATLLDELKPKGVHVTFFLVGKNAAAYPQLVAREAQEGHAIGNHTWAHADLTELSTAQATQAIAQTDQTIVAAGAPQPTMVRPPYGSQNAAVMQLLKSRGEAGVFWNIDSQDWKNLNAAATTARVLQARRGSIVLMHDIHPTTVQAIPGIIDQLRAAGFTLVTVPQLLGTSPRTYAGLRIFGQWDIEN